MIYIPYDSGKEPHTTSSRFLLISLDTGENSEDYGGEEPQDASLLVPEEYSSVGRDTHDLKDVRLAAYSAAWKRCFDRIHVRPCKCELASKKSTGMA